MTRECAWIVRAAALLVPADMRRDWTREWLAEVCYRARRDAGLLLLIRTLGAFAHAAWLRWDRWRLEMLLQDIRYGVRALVRKPGFTVTTVLTLALGIGANAAIFSAVRAVLLRPLPFPDADRLVNISSTTVRSPNLPNGAASPADFIDWRHHHRSFTEIAALNAGSYALIGEGAAEQIPGANVTGGFFNVLSVPPLHGRTLLPNDDAAGAEMAAVLGYGLWSRRFGSNPAVVGKTVSLEGDVYRIVGVMPRGFAYPLQSEVWLPQRFSERDYNTQRGAHYLDVIGRLKPEISLQQAAQDMDAIARQLAVAYPNNDKDSRISLHPLRDAIVGSVGPALLTMLGAVGFVLLIVCVNVANLVLTRALGRARETAIRTALGAGRVRLVRGVLVESMLLAVAGGATGLAVAFWGSRGIAALQEALAIPLLEHTRVDGTVVAFTAGISIAAALLFGTLPAWQTAAVGHLTHRLRADGGHSTGDRKRHRIRGLLIVSETALAVILLVGAGLLLRSFAQLTSVQLGFNAQGVQTFNISLPASKYVTPLQRATFVESLIEAVEKQPGVEAVGAIFGMPLTNFRYSISTSTIDGRKLDNDEQTQKSVQVRIVTADYFRSLGIPIVLGRALSSDDRLGSPLSLVVNETAATRFWPDTSPLGHELTLGTRMGQGGANAGGAVVGVAKDVHDFGPTVTVRPTVYLSHAQFPVAAMTLTVRTSNQPSVGSLRATLAAMDADLPMYRVRTAEQLTKDAVAQPRAYALLLSLFASVAVVLAAIGIYGVLTHAVSQRTREIGIRLALGAKRGEVIAMVVRQAAVLAMAGLGAGLALAVFASSSLGRLLFGVTPTDAATYAAVTVGLFLIALLASYVPARRASRVDPMTALRYE